MSQKSLESNKHLSEPENDADLDYLEMLPQLSMEKQVSSVRPLILLKA